MQRFPPADGCREGADNVRELEEEHSSTRVGGNERRGADLHAGRRRHGRGWGSEPVGVLHSHVQTESRVDGRVQNVDGGFGWCKYWNCGVGAWSSIIIASINCLVNLFS